MARVMAVTLEPHGLLHYLDPGPATYRVGDLVLFPTDSGPEVATCVWVADVDAAGFEALPVCGGAASEADLRRDETNRRIRAEALAVARALVAKHELPMKVVGIDYIDRSTEFDRQVVIYFQAAERVDFRALLSDLARTLRARIDLRQIAARDAARITGGIGNCGRPLCCVTFLGDLEPVSVRLARPQGLPANPMQISGACGRLMCCLRYEHPLYAEFARDAPPIGSDVGTPDGDGVVVAHSVPGQRIDVRRPDGEVVSCPIESVCPARTVTAKQRRAPLLRRNRGKEER